MGKFGQIITELSAHDMIMAGYYSVNVFINKSIGLLVFCLKITDRTANSVDPIKPYLMCSLIWVLTVFPGPTA